MMQIFTHTPVWVWLLLAGLCLLGYSQTKTRQVTLQRVLIMPLVMLLLSLRSMHSGIGADPFILGAWAITVALSGLLFVRRPLSNQHHYDHTTQRFTIAGSWLPMFLILAMFIAQYALNVSLAIRPELAQHAKFTLGFAILFGIFNGAFLARPIKLIRLKNQSQEQLAQATQAA
ncbi:DUF6622 family protein [Undibacterium flavidum]|uniref:Transmembrane protein n=1 Tax=Undibacterium flavidum TaxID=2762297 RepID=A0ABR6Y919_9BURK|nr:DUF6622 family protein [Undibacterium flavidum]MBC3873083.1 hypothetical protein [Undibacterium flavidum]